MGISIWQLLIILAIVLVLFGAKRLRNLGGDLGTAVRGFREAVRDGEKTGEEDVAGHVGNGTEDAEGNVIDGEAREEETTREQN